MASLRVNVVLFVLCVAFNSSAMELDELESVLTVLRTRGHALFSNAIVTSDVVYDVLDGNNNNSSSSFTFLAPTDTSLFVLDMANTASEYTSTVRCHVIPLRLSLADLRRFPSGYAVRTLAKDRRRIHVGKSRDGEGVEIDGVRLVAPELFYSGRIAVHGLGGILSCSGPESPPEPPISGANSPDYSHRNRTRTPPKVIRRRRHANHTGNPRSSSGNHSTVQPVNTAISTATGESPAPVYTHGTVYFSPIGVPTVSTLSPVTEPPAIEDSARTVDFAPTYDTWRGSPSASAAFSPESSENDDPVEGEKEQLWRTGVDADLTAIIQSEPLNEETFYNCRLNADTGIDHVRSHGYCASI